jgi:hypothetical protein
MDRDLEAERSGILAGSKKMTALKDTLAHLSELHCSKDGKLESALNIRWKSENGA